MHAHQHVQLLRRLAERSAAVPQTPEIDADAHAQHRAALIWRAGDRIDLPLALGCQLQLVGGFACR